MSSLQYVGKNIASASDVNYKSYVDTVKTTVLTEASVDSSISTAIAPYATQSYADNQDGTKALTSYVDSQDNLRVLSTTKGQPNGPVPLDSAGAISLNDLVNAGVETPSTDFQYSSQNMITTNQTISGTSTMNNLGRIAIPYSVNSAPWLGPWIPLVWANFECRSTSGATPWVEVRYSGTTSTGSTSGAVVGRGFAATRTTDWMPLNVYPDASALSGYTAATWPLPKVTGTSTIYLHLYGRSTASTSVTIGYWQAMAVCMILPG